MPMRRACLTFVGELRAAADEHGTTRAFTRRAFAACDELRACMRVEGWSLADVSSDGAYQRRVVGLAAAGDYMLKASSLQALERSFGRFTVDAFASGATAQLPRFWSAEATEGAAGIDAFEQEWAGEHLLVHAPISCLPDVVTKLEGAPRASAVVVAPYWTGAPWFEPLSRLSSSTIVLPAGSLRAVASGTGHVRSWRAICFHVPKGERARR